jgi:hypothetical protein
MKLIALFAATLLGVRHGGVAHATFPDASGRTGTATTNSNGTTLLRDGMGRTNGTATRR